MFILHNQLQQISGWFYTLPAQYTVFITISFIFVITRIVKTNQNLKSVDHLKGHWTLFPPLSLLGALLPTFRLNPGLGFHWPWRYTIYKKYGYETISFVPLLSGSASVYTSSIEVAQQVLGGKEFYKGEGSNAVLQLWGDNVISSNDEMYKRHRRIVGPAFGANILPFVWSETCSLYEEMMATEGWSDQSSVDIEAFTSLSSKFALTIISRCGFDLPAAWNDSNFSTHTQNLRHALQTVNKSALIRLATPRWLYKLPIKRLQELECAYLDLKVYMNSFVTSRKGALARGEVSTDPAAPNYQPDMFTRLVSANQIGDGKLALSDEELIGNMFAFLFAGQDTTSQVLAATVGLLAVHPVEQDIAVKQINSVLSEGRMPQYSDMEKLKKVLACFLEAGRMFPAAKLATRDTRETVTLTTPTAERNVTFVLSPKTRVVIDFIGIHYNPRHFPEPHIYKPSRWYDAQDPDLTFFGMGPRACIGKRFAMTEAVCFLTLLLRDWRTKPLLKDGESQKQWEERVFQEGNNVLAFGVAAMPVTLVRRK